MLKRIANRDSTALIPVPLEAAGGEEEALQLIELRCLDLAVAWRRDVRSNEGMEFRDYCSLAFDIRRVLPLGENEDARVKGAIRFAAVGVLGDRSADIRRYLSENIWPVPPVKSDEAGWPRKQFSFEWGMQLLRVVRKKNWDDLSRRGPRDC